MTKDQAIEIVKETFKNCEFYEFEFGYNDNWSEEHEARDMAIEALKRDDPEMEFKKRFEKTTFCGYSAEKLLMFADACKRNNITEEELHDFCLNAESAFNYILSKIQEESAKRLS